MNKYANNMIGQVCATYQTEEVLKPGDVCQFCGNNMVETPVKDSNFGGLIQSVEKDGSVVVILKGYVESTYTGDTVPSFGWCKLTTGETGKVSCGDTGREYLVVFLDEDTREIGFYI